MTNEHFKTDYQVDKPSSFGTSQNSLSSKHNEVDRERQREKEKERERKKQQKQIQKDEDEELKRAIEMSMQQAILDEQRRIIELKQMSSNQKNSDKPEVKKNDFDFNVDFNNKKENKAGD